MGRRSKDFIYLLMLYLITAFAAPCAAQEASLQTVHGTVICADNGTPISGAFVSFIKGNKIVASCLCDGDGCFSMSFCKDIPEFASASMLGYTPTKIQIGQGKLTIRLKEKKLSIKASSVTASVIESKGDTTSYSVGAFLDKGDLTAADILKKLPGITITESGGIIHNGKPINKFYIEGLDLMGGRYGMITNNLSVKDISKIEVYRDHQPVKVLKGIVRTGQSAVNIILKESSKNTWLFNGDIAAGGPGFPLFEAKALTTRFSSQSQDLYMLKGNSTGEDVVKEVREQSYFGKTGAFLVSIDDLDSDFRSELSPRKNAMEIPQEFWFDNISGIGTFNHLHKTGQDSQIRAAVQIAAEKYSEQAYTNESISFDAVPELVIAENKTAEDTRYYFNTTAHFEKNATKNFLSDELSVTGQWISDNAAATRAADVSGQQSRLPSLKVENILKSTTGIRNNKVIDFSSKTTFLANVHSATFRTGSADMGQALNCTGFRTHNNVSYRFRIRDVGLSSYAGLNLEHLRRESLLTMPYELSWITHEDFRATSVAPLINILSTYNKGGCSLRISLSARLDMIFTSGYGNRFVPDLSPGITYTQKLAQNWELGANANYSRSGSEVLTLSKAAIMNSYRSAKVSDGMTTTDRVTSNIYVKYSDTPAMLFITLTGIYNHIRRNKTSSNIYDGIFLLSTLVDRPDSYRNYSVNGNITKYFGIKAFVAELSGGYDRYTSGEYLQEKYFSYSGEHAYASLKARTAALDWLSAEISADYAFDRMTGNKSSGRHSATSEASLYITPVKPLLISLKADYFWWHSSSGQVSVSNTPILKCHVSWKFKKFSIFAECRNILGTTEFRKEYFNPHKTVSNIFHLRGREYLAGIRMSM